MDRKLGDHLLAPRHPDPCPGGQWTTLNSRIPDLVPTPPVGHRLCASSPFPCNRRPPARLARSVPHSHPPARGIPDRRREHGVSSTILASFRRSPRSGALVLPRDRRGASIASHVERAERESRNSKIPRSRSATKKRDPGWIVYGYFRCPAGRSPYVLEKQSLCSAWLRVDPGHGVQLTLSRP